MPSLEQCFDWNKRLHSVIIARSRPVCTRTQRGASSPEEVYMTRKKPDYKKAAEEASAAFMAMKIKQGTLHGSYLGSGDRKWAIERLRRWCDLAVEHLSTEMIDQMAWRIEMYLAAEALH